MASPTTHEIQLDIRRQDVLAGPRLGSAAVIALVIGLAGLGGSALIGFVGGAGAERFYFSYLQNFCYFTSLALGALFFVFIQHLTSAGWSVVVRRYAEVVATNSLVLAVLFIPILLGAKTIFHWLDPQVVADDPLLNAKAPYLSQTFFLIRVVAYFAIWIALSQYFLARSRKQDETGDFRITMELKRVSAPTAILFAVTTTFFAIDMLMSLDAHWFSTIFGVYFFAGSALGFFALLPLMIYLTQRMGKLREFISSEHYQDMGKFCFAFTVFWAYIAFSQYMLIWYGNIPEETEWFLKRQTGGWTTISWILLLGHFVLPFLMLISRYPKRRGGLLIFPAIWILIVHWIDIYYLSMPELPHGTAGVVPWSWLDLTCFIGIGGVFVAAALFRFRGLSLIPRQDPRLAESLRFEQVGG